jgi:hypothetical protein
MSICKGFVGNLKMQHAWDVLKLKCNMIPKMNALIIRGLNMNVQIVRPNNTGHSDESPYKTGSEQ